MGHGNRLWWLKTAHNFHEDVAKSKVSSDPVEILRDLADSDLDLSQVLSLDRLIKKISPHQIAAAGLTPIKLAILGSSTLDHLLPGLRVAGLRHGFHFDVYQVDYGQYISEVLNPSSGLYQFGPEIVVFALDAMHLIGMDLADEPEQLLDTVTNRLTGLWRVAREKWGAQVIQQAVMPTLPSYVGGAEHRLATSPARLVAELNVRLRHASPELEVDILGIDVQVGVDGLDAWHDPALWLRAKQEISPAAAHHYAELIARLISARRGRSGKCLVLDLDNTLWGGVIGDDGLAGIKLGQGTAQGEAFVAFQRYIRGLSKRGVILAVCSKNDEVNALEPFEKHEEMVLKREHIASFAANWQDKATNLRQIAAELNIGLDALVFVDDNPFERNIVRRELPMVRVPELPEDPALYIRCVEQSGYFEAVTVTHEDITRTELYQARRAAEGALGAATDLEGYLKSLDMVLEWRRFDELGRQRITQLVNKTNQFNLTTHRYTDATIGSMITDPGRIGIQVRLRDTYADHGIIAILVGNLLGGGICDIETWLMSCRVLGRQVEQACFQVIAEEAKAAGARVLTGRYLPTAKNAMVKAHYQSLGFDLVEETAEGASTWRIELDRFEPQPLFIEIVKV